MDKALIVLDMINSYIYGPRPLVRRERRASMIKNIRKTVELAHRKHVPVIYISCEFEEGDPILKVIGYYPQPMKGSEGARIIPVLRPKKGDYVLGKKGYDGFWKSGLEGLLKKLRTKEIYIVGQQTDCCVRETGVTAAHLGYKVDILEDCVDSSREMGHDAAIRFMSTCVGTITDSKHLDW